MRDLRLGDGPQDEGGLCNGKSEPVPALLGQPLYYSRSLCIMLSELEEPRGCPGEAWVEQMALQKQAMGGGEY